MYLDRGRVHRIARGILTLGFALALFIGTAQAADTLHFAVGPLQPTPGETKKAFDPFFKHLAEQLGVAYTLEATTDWAGIAVALASGQVDVAWMGPWGYVIAHNQGA
ncbi:MAG TPA: PhnD/SsuA/transferrin family substrate-binding protein, partial [Stellaceae bacterium]|nr:PhnD/SsuA/transferrin family substrate-binding protein [Stellaceae bacterium]HEX3417930.1 PhnD/SsuA/transferrin family substrate-binding protein [Stellaceae bacterium]